VESRASIARRTGLSSPSLCDQNGDEEEVPVTIGLWRDVGRGVRGLWRRSCVCVVMNVIYVSEVPWAGEARGRGANRRGRPGMCLEAAVVEKELLSTSL